ncbi:hypothetical protein E3N88_40231 [Mikania micrantha]|uniref:Uncharacterized protein n=1 Tax=Mikania micrantha TaxID=192012 RepID=A0A5N6LM57_9ASTR|nr:hypothetical protein E3N88_40231 [Mikania micrantha]
MVLSLDLSAPILREGRYVCEIRLVVLEQADLAVFLYFRVDNVESYAWTPRTTNSVEKRVRYERLKFGFLERERVDELVERERVVG